MSKEAVQAHKAAAAVRRLKEENAPYGTKPPEESRSPHWAHVRKAHLEMEPACQVCGTTEHLQVHHKLPFHLYPALELDHSNLITLCERPSHSDHLLFGHLYNWQSWNPHVVDDVARMAKEILNRPQS